MMTSNPSSYDDLESNRKAENTTLVEQEPCISDLCAANCCISTTIAILVYPFIICDMYYAVTDDSCVNQQVDLAINMHQYLFASSIIGIVSVSIANTCLISINIFNCVGNEDNVCWQIIRCILRLFSLSWLILGCVLFWGKMNYHQCAHPVHNYLFARFILFIVLSAGDGRISMENNKK